MASEAQKAMADVENLTQAWASIFVKIIEEITKKAENRDRTAPMRALARAIVDGNGKQFTIVGKGLEASVKEELRKNGIPFMTSYDKDKIFVMNTDVDRIAEINKQCLIARSNYYQVVGADELENAIARDERIKNKGIIELKDLSFYEAEVLKHKCNDISKGFTVGATEKENGKYDLLMRTNKVYEYNPKRTDFCEASARYVMSLFGPNSLTKIKQVEDDAKVDKLIAKLKDERDEHWLVSADDPTKYIHFYPIRDEDGEIKTRWDYVERKFARDKEGRRIVIDSSPSYTGTSDEPDYEVALLRATDRICNKAIIDNYSDFEKHMATTNRTINPQRAEKTREQASIAIGERAVADKINVMIKERFEQGNGSPTAMFKLYRDEFVKLLNAIRDNTIPEGYKASDMANLKNITQKHGMNINDYQLAISKYKDLEPFERQAKVKSKEAVVVSKDNIREAIRKDNVEER